MTLLETKMLLEHIAENDPNINDVVESGNIFDLNNEEYEQQYSAFCVTQNQHNIGIDYSTYSFTMFYVDRLTLDKKNRIEIQSSAIQFFHNFIKTIENEYFNLNYTNGMVQTFEQRFSAECAGAFMTIDITTTNNSVCSEIEQKLGEFAPEEFSNSFFKVVNMYI